MAEIEQKETGKKVLLVSSSPHVLESATSRRIMFEVVIGCVPAVAAAIYFFRLSAVMVLVTSLVVALASEAVFNWLRKRPLTIGDGSVIITALILALSLPSTIPAWAAAVGVIVAVVVGKMLFGGLGSNIFNPAMVGRAFLMACFGTMMTNWVAPAGVVPPTGPQQVQATSQPTPLALAKQPIKDRANPDIPANLKATPQEVNQDIENMFLGRTSGSMGETSAICWLIGGVFLLLRRTITWHIPVAVLGSAGLIATIAWWSNPAVYANPLVHLFGGGMMMGAFFIATDPVTCPLANRGRIIFGVGVGVLIMLIRLLGGYPEGVMYAVLLMNAMTPLLDLWTRPTPLGGHVRAG